MFDYDLLKKVATEVSELEEYKKLEKRQIKCENIKEKISSEKLLVKLAIGSGVVAFGGLFGHMIGIVPEEDVGKYLSPIFISIIPYLTGEYFDIFVVKSKNSKEAMIRDTYIMHKSIQDDMKKGWTLQEAHMRYQNMSKDDLFKKESEFYRDVQEHIEQNGEFELESFIEKENSPLDNFLNYHNQKKDKQVQQNTEENPDIIDEAQMKLDESEQDCAM